MTFPSSLLVFLTFFFLGGTAGNAVRMVRDKLLWERKLSLRRKSFRFSAMCVSFSLAVALFASLLILANKTALFDFKLLSFRPSVTEILFFAKSFFLGFLAALFLKIALPLLPAVFAFLWIFSYAHLSARFFCEKDFIETIVQEKSVKIGGKNYSPGISLKVTSFRLPETFIIPVRRNWYDVQGAKKKTSAKDSAKKKSLVSAQYDALFEKNKKSLSVQMPEENVFPSLYTLRFKDRKAFFKKEL